MNIVTKLVSEWPKLAWVAFCTKGKDRIIVYHGPYVETNADWCIEGVWDSNFDAGDFDRTDLIVGTGIRIRENKAIFVTPGNTVDRIWSYHSNSVWYISNSLPAVLAIAKLDLIDKHDYPGDLNSVILGLNRYVRTIPTSGGDLNVTYFHNLLYDGENLKEIPKPNTSPQFETFEEYYRFLLQTAERISANYKSPARQHRITPLVTLSRGYDTPAVSVIAKHAGCEQAITIKKTDTVIPRSDSGEIIAKYLGLKCRCYNRIVKNYPYEEAIWACMGIAWDLTLTLFEYAEPLILLFSGFHGDKVWDRRHIDLSEPLWRGENDGGGFTEFRLIKGIFNCPVPFWGIQNVQKIQAISTSDEMKPWTLYNNYDRPIPRRIVEEAGVPRGAFAVRNRWSAITLPLAWPYSPELRKAFRKYLEARDHKILPVWKVKLSKLLHALDKSVVRRIPVNMFKIPVYGTVVKQLRCSRLIQFPASHLFCFANEQLKREYEKAFTDFASLSSINDTEKRR